MIETIQLSRSLTTESAAPGNKRPLTTLELRTTYTPWGAPDGGDIFLPGIELYHTPSHGGFHLSSTRLAQLPKILAEFPTFCGEPGWFEEDCDWCYAVLGFPRVFEPRLVHLAFRQAQQTPFDDKYRKVANWLTGSNDPDAVFLRNWVDAIGTAKTNTK